MNMPELLQQHFNYAPLQKIDPNTQEVKENNQPGKEAFGQAAIPVILIGLYKYTRTDDGAAQVVSGENSSAWVKKIFSDYADTIISRVSEYAATSSEETESKLNDIANKAVALIKETVSSDNKITAIKELMSNQKNTILTYLPAVLQTGELIDDTTVDDRTNKMEGPISSLIQAIGSGFTASDKDEKIEK